MDMLDMEIKRIKQKTLWIYKNLLFILIIIAILLFGWYCIKLGFNILIDIYNDLDEMTPYLFIKKTGMAFLFWSLGNALIYESYWITHN